VKGVLLAAWLCLMGLLAGMRLRHTEGREAAAWLATGLVATLLAPLGRVTVLPYALAIFAFIVWGAVAYGARPRWRECAPLALTAGVVALLVCLRTWLMTGVALATPDVIVDIQSLLGWHLRDDVGCYTPAFHTPFPSGLLQSLFGPSAYIHQALFWMGNAWIPLLVLAFALHGWRWILRGAMPFWLALGMSMYVLLYAYRYGPDGPDGNYFIVPIVVLHLAAWAGCTRTWQAAEAPRPFLAGWTAMLALCLFLVLTTANWFPGLTRLDANFRRTPFGELERIAAARFRISGMGPLAAALNDWPVGTRMVGDMPEGDGGVFPVRYESLSSISWARPPLVTDAAAIQSFLISHDIALVALSHRPAAPVSVLARSAMAILVAEGQARPLRVEGAPADLWVMDATRETALDGKIADKYRK
jgi:hypothetical protein